MAKLGNYKLVAEVNHVYGYDTTKLYSFALYDSSLAVGDYAIVGTMSNPQIVKVKAIYDITEAHKVHIGISKAILGKLDMSAYLVHQEKEAKIAKLRKEMDAKKKEIDSRKDDAYYAGLDTSYAGMFEEMKRLQND